MRTTRTIEQTRKRVPSRSPASGQRCRQRWAVAGDMLKATAAAFSVIPASVALTSAKRPASARNTRWGLPGTGGIGITRVLPARLCFRPASPS
jgi:hypothetical protein